MSLFRQTLEADAEMPNAAPTLSGMWYIAAINSGATAINLIEKGTASSNLKEFAGMTIISVIAGRKGILHLEQYLDSRSSQSERQTMPLQQADLS